MSKLRTKLMVTGATIGLLLSVDTLAFAQSGPDDTRVKKVRADEIIVTARKREENIQDVPLAISAYTSQMIIDNGIRDMADVAKMTAGFSLDDEFGRVNSDRPVIRGQSTILGSSGVSTFVDGILISGSLLDYDVNDVERIEVIKGPQSALYGRNTYSGAVNIITKSPSDDASGGIKLDVGNYDRYELSGAVRGPITDTLSGNISGRHYSRGGTFTNIYDGSKVGQQKSSSLSGTLFYDPQDDLSVRARLRWSKLNDDQPRLFVTDPAMNNIFPDIGGTYNGRNRYFDGEIMAEDINIDDIRSVGEKGYDKSEDIQGSLSIKYDLNENATLEFLNGVNFNTSDGIGDLGYTEDSLTPFSVYLGNLFGNGAAYVTSGINDFATDYKSNSRNFSSELRLNYGTEKWDGLIGGYYYTSTGKYTGRREAPPGFAATIEEGYNTHIARMQSLCTFAGGCFFSVNFGDSLQDLQLSADRSISKSYLDNIAGFASANYYVTDKITVGAEARYTSEKVESRSISKQAVYDYLGDIASMNEAPETRRSKTFNSFNPRFTAKYKASDATNLYAVAAHGNKPGGFNNDNLTAQGLGTYDEETVWSYELGAKNSFLDGDLVLNIAAFHNTIKGYQLTQSVIIQNSNTTTTAIDNVGKVRLMGIEVEGNYHVPSVDGLNFTANYAYTDSDILEGTDIGEGRHLDTLDDMRVNCSIGYAVITAPLDCNSGDNVLPGSIVGRQLPRQAKHMANLGVNYTQPISDKMDFFLNSNLSYESKKYSQVHNLAYVGAATLLSGNIGFETDRYRVAIWGKNLTDEKSVVQAIRFIDEAWSFQRAFGGTPRIGPQYGVTVSANF